MSEKEVTRTGKIKNQHYLDACEDEIRRYRKICDSVGFKIETMTVDQITDLIKAGETGDNFDLDFVQFGREYAASLENRGNAQIYMVAINNLIRFTGREQISVHEITTKFVRDWVTWIKNNPIRANTKTNRAQSLYPANIRALHNAAKNTYNDEDSGIIRIHLSPFKNIKIEKFRASRQRFIDVETLRMIAALQYVQTYKNRTDIFNFAKDLFILSFALIGMNAADLYECTDIKNDRITYNRKKLEIAVPIMH
ncbi:MAG: phage integrase SAM-like domain-containing protein [Prevotellaceae bacterium]|nr:phage integrase SAM-like domain-containing protein [Prevotellaceae bacterium]